MAEPIVALATPPSPAPLAIIRLDGDGCIEALMAIIPQCRRSLEARHPSAIEILWHEDGEAVPAIATTFLPPGSFTGGESVEIVVPGSPPIVRGILEQFRRQGVRPATPGEFTRRAFVGGKIDLTRAESVAALIEAEDLAAVAAARRVLEGELAHSIGEIGSRLLDLVAFLEAGLDFTEQEVEGPRGEEVASQIQGIAAAISALLDRRREGRAEPLAQRILLWGRPNAGKSTLLNALVGREAALTSGDPGTTTDPVLARVLLPPGGEVDVIDLAGNRTATDAVEKRALELSLRWLRGGEPVLYLLDSSCRQE
ncbi:MAG TPA: tRNA uridine-5-carboxymethylaminomethyl(34) synthesis GTPase MnmE, partial [Planctomycetes bacterium]|nr:tRNA uridine-5-carboxymethylaminomethyl(34) synthesis GTPase MnmE [Planctomycetota bacterium]